MGFIEEYKRLDNLCKDLFSSSIGVTEYINCMEQCGHYSSYVDNWRRDYLDLKHYRYIRNKIVHENGATEAALCTDDDIIWINSFYQRILNQTDPLSLYQKVKDNYGKKSSKASDNKRSKSANGGRNNTANFAGYSYQPQKNSKRSAYSISGLIVAAVIVVIIVAAVCLLLNFGLPE